MSRKLKRFGRNSSSKRSRPHISFTTFILVFAGSLLICLSLLWQYHQARVLSFSAPRIEESNEIAQVAIPQQLTIPDIGIDLDILPTRIVDGVWEISDSSASHLETSSNPGQNGNIVIYGHNKQDLLGNLKRAKVGQTIYIVTADRGLHTYQIQEILTVDPTDIEVVQPTTTEILTIYTCTGFLDSKRLIIKALPADI